MKLALFAILALCGTLASRVDESLAVDGGQQPGEGFGLWQPLEAGSPSGMQPPAVAAQQLPPATANLVITYVDVPMALRPAVERAAAIWESAITSPVEIRGTVSAVALNGAFLARTRTAHHVKDPVEDPNLPLAGVRYPAALAHTIRGTRSNENADFEIELNSLVSDWYAGDDGQPPGDQYDLVTVVLHEIAHGLGMDSGMGVVNGLAVASPTAFDALLTLRDGTKVYTRPLASLIAVLTGDEVLLSGPSVILAAGGSAPRVHAPSPFEAGSSIGHFHSFHGFSDDDGLMVSQVFNGWAYHDPGPMLLATLKDIGWQISRLGQAARVRVVTAMPSFIPDRVALFPIRVEVQDPVGLLVTSASGTSIDLEAFGEVVSGAGDWECTGSRTRVASGGKATFESCTFDGKGYAAIYAFAPGLVAGSTHQFRIADLSTRRAPAIARGP